MTWNLVFDALLIVGFGVQHSVIATLKVKTRIASRTGIQPLTLRATQSFINVAYIFAAIAVCRLVTTRSGGDSTWRDVRCLVAVVLSTPHL